MVHVHPCVSHPANAVSSYQASCRFLEGCLGGLLANLSGSASDSERRVTERFVCQRNEPHLQLADESHAASQTDRVCVPGTFNLQLILHNARVSYRGLVNVHSY